MFAVCNVAAIRMQSRHHMRPNIASPPNAGQRVTLLGAGVAALLMLAWARRRARPSALSPRKQALISLSDAMALRSIWQRRIGMDIGGTLAKMAVVSEPGKDPFAHIAFRNTTTTHPELAFDKKGSDASVHFLSIPTHLLEATMRSVRDRMGALPWEQSQRLIVTAGGGGHRFRRMFREVLHTELVPFKELQAVVGGLQFLREHGPPSTLFTVNADGVESVGWPEEPFPFLLVVMGSGVSVLRVTGPGEFTRVGGTACGGATFLGLGRALTGLSDFADLMRMASRGDAGRVDKSVGDIYGDAGCTDLGMPASHTAASFGRLATLSPTEMAADDAHADAMVCALLRMVAQASVVLAKAYASAPGAPGGSCLDRVFYVGGFAGADENEMARTMIAESMRAVGGRAIFCKHAPYLGALGSLNACLERHRAEASRTS